MTTPDPEAVKAAVKDMRLQLRIANRNDFEFCADVEAESLRLLLSALEAAERERDEARKAATWEGDHQRDALLAISPALAEEFPFGCDAIDHVAHALVAARRQRDEARDMLFEVVCQACSTWVQSGDPLDGLDSTALSAYADALRYLAERGKVEIVSESGRRVIARLKA